MVILYQTAGDLIYRLARDAVGDLTTYTTRIPMGRVLKKVSGFWVGGDLN